MLKKLTLLAASVAALVAFAAPATAQANPIIENALGEEALEVFGDSSSYFEWTTNGGAFACRNSTFALTGSEGSYTGTGTAEGSLPLGTETGPCESTNGRLIEFTSMSVDLDLEGEGSGTADISYSYQYGLPKGPKTQCSFTGNNLSATYAPGDNWVSISGSLTGTGCQAVGTLYVVYEITDEYGEVATLH